MRSAQPRSGQPADVPPARPGRREGRRLAAGMVWLALVLAGAALAGLTLLPGPAPAARQRAVIAALPYWNIGQVGATVLAHRPAFTEVSPWMYGLTAAGGITTQYRQARAAGVEKQIARLRASGLPIVPTLANTTAGKWAYQPIAAILHDPARMRAHVAAVAALVRQHRYAGIDIDYENLRSGDRQAFTAFIRALGTALHAEGKTLSVAVFAKTSNAGVDQRNRAQDYAAIGRVADQVRVMAYDYHWPGSAPGPIAPITWVRGVLRYAESQMPASKIILGIPLWGYDWSGGRAVAVSWLHVFRLATRYRAPVHYATASQSPWLTYTASGVDHVVWFENHASTRAKLIAAQGMGIGGVFLWMFGYEDASTWAALRGTLPVSRHAAHALTPGHPGGAP